MEGWPNVMASCFDANTKDSGPDFNNTFLFTYIYFIAFILVGSMFLMNLFQGVIYLQFSEQTKLDKFAQFPEVEECQLNWIEMQPLIAQSKPEFSMETPPENKYRLIIFKLVTNLWFDAFIMFLIIVNIFTMGMIYEEMSITLLNVLTYMNHFFTFSFIIEATLKLFG